MSGLAILAVLVLIICFFAGVGLIIWGSHRADNWVTYIGIVVVVLFGAAVALVSFPSSWTEWSQGKIGVKNAYAAADIDDEGSGNDVVWQDDKDGGSLKVTLGKGTKRLYVGRNEHGKDLRLFQKGGQWSVKANFNPLPTGGLWWFTYDSRGNVKEAREIAKLPIAD